MNALEAPVTVPTFVTGINNALRCHKNIQVLTGDIQGLFPSHDGKSYLNLEQSLVETLSPEYIVVALDMVGLSFYSDLDVPLIANAMPAVEKELSLKEQVEAVLEKPKSATERFMARVAAARYAPLTSMALLKDIFYHLQGGKKVGPICVIIRHASALFPERDLGSLDQQDRQRLVYFLNWINETSFNKGENIFLLLDNSRSDINKRIWQQSNCEHLQIPLPTLQERLTFLQIRQVSSEILDMSVEEFADCTAGLPLASLEDLLEIAQSNKSKVTKKDVVDAINLALRVMLGDIVTFKPPDHHTADIIGFDTVKTVLQDIFEDCNDPQTAVPGILVSGANGVGKTWIMEALAFDSGWVVIELSGLRNELFGGTEKFFEQFRLVASTFGRILVEVDEAHTAFGSVHSSQTHEVEKRLSGNLIKMMGNPAYNGKILWILMTSRPDELDPDIKSRTPTQIPIFDLEGAERLNYLKALFQLKKVEVNDDDLKKIAEKTTSYSNRDLGFLLKIYTGRKRRNQSVTVLQFLETWQAGTSIQRQRKFQELLAAQHCTFPELLPERIKNISPENREEEIEKYRYFG